MSDVMAGWEAERAMYGRWVSKARSICGCWDCQLYTYVEAERPDGPRDDFYPSEEGQEGKCRPRSCVASAVLRMLHGNG